MRQKLIALLMGATLLFSCLAAPTVDGGGTVFAAKTLEEIEQQQAETRDAINDAEKNKREAQENVNSLQNEANQIQSQYNYLYGQLSAINKKIETANASIVLTQSEINALEMELEEAKNQEDKQYEAMKDRIVYFYENSPQMNIFMLLFSSGSFAEFLNRTSTMMKIMDYDRELLSSYQELQETISAKSDELAVKALELKGYQDDLSASQDEMGELITGASAALNQKNGEVGDAEAELLAYEQELTKLKKRMKSLEKQAADAQAAAARALAEQLAKEQEDGTIEDTSGSISATASDVQILAATIQAESDNQSYEGKLAVGSVIMNRVKSSKFPNTIYGVVSQDRQFASYSSGMVDAILKKGPNEACTSVANEVIGGKRNGNWLFFMTKAAADGFGIVDYQQIGDHVFFLIWKTNKPAETSASSGTQGDSAGTSSGESDSAEDALKALMENNEKDTSEDDGESDDSESGFYFDESGNIIPLSP